MTAVRSIDCMAARRRGSELPRRFVFSRVPKLVAETRPGMKIGNDMSHAEQQSSRERPTSSAALLLCVTLIERVSPSDACSRHFGRRGGR
jgi:hypothetical protein